MKSKVQIMGKNKHASFSSTDKSSFQLLKAKFKENSFKKHLGRGRAGNTKHDGTGEKEEKEKNRFWWKWLNFVRGHWSCQEMRSNDKKKEKVVPDNKLKVMSNPSKSKLIQIPIEPEEKFSGILIKPTKTGIKAMIAQYRGPFVYSERAPGYELTASEDHHEIKRFEKNEKNDGEKRKKADGKRLTWNADVFESKTELAKNSESLLNSAPFFRQDMDNIVESTVFIEPNFPKDFTDSKKSDEINQKSLKINERHVSYKILRNERSGRIFQTIKTVSEPTWDKKKKIIQQQQLQDNINDLLEQFMFLEAEDVIDFSISQGQLSQSYKRLEFSGNSNLSSRQPLIRELSRKVSPQILVNVKPFKEYVSDDYLNIKDSSTELLLKNYMCANKNQNDTIKNTAIEMLVKPKNASESEEILERNPFSVFKCVATGTKVNDCECDEESFSEVTEKGLSLSVLEKKFNSNCYENCVELVSDQINDNFDTPLPSCTLLGVYRSYSFCKNPVQEEEEEILKKDTLIAKINLDEVLDNLDEVLDNLDDSDHDVIFQKNISQFRKKINSMPRFGIKQTVFFSENMERKNAKITRNAFVFVKPVKSCTEKMKKTGAYRLDCSELWKMNQISKKILGNIFWQLSKAELICRILATRIEARTISFPQTLREMHDMLENNNFTIMEIEMPMNLINKEVLKPGSSEILQWAGKSSLDVKKYETVVAVFSFQGRDFDGKFCTVENDIGNLGRHILESSKFFLNTPGCFYLVQNQLLLDYEPKRKTNLKSLNVCQKSCSECIKDPTKIEKDEENSIEVIRNKQNILKFSDSFCKIVCRFVRILIKPSYEYIARIYDCKSGAVHSSSKSKTEGDMLWNNLTSSNSSHSKSLFSGLGSPIPTERMIPFPEPVSHIETQAFNLANDKKSNFDLHFDDFQILYNNSRESLYDEEDASKMVFARNFPQENSSVFFLIEKKILSKEMEQKEEEEEEEEENEEERGKKKRERFNEEIEILKNLERKISRCLKCRSNSSPREDMYQTESYFQEHRMRKSLVLPKETEKDFHSHKRRRLSLDKGIEIRKTESVFLESHTVTLGNEKLYVQKSPSLVYELKNLTESENRIMDQKNKFLPEKSETNVRKEVIAAFNTIKKLNNGKGGRTRMSLVIMLSRK